MTATEINAEMLELLKQIQGILFGKSNPTNLDRIMIREIRNVVQKAETSRTANNEGVSSYGPASETGSEQHRIP